MPRRQDPLSVKVMEYFRTAEISAAETVLQLAQDELRKRKGAPLTLAGNKKKKLKGALPLPAPESYGPQ